MSAGAATSGEPVVPLSLRLVGDQERPLTKAQKRFDALLRKVETLRAEKVRLGMRWEKFLQLYRERIHPEEQRMVERRRQVVRLLEAYWRAPKGLGSRQRDNLEGLLRAQLAVLVDIEGEALEVELKKLWVELNWIEPASDKVAGEAGADHADDAEGAAPKPEFAEEKMDEEPEPEVESPPKSERARAAEAKAAERLAQREEARKRTVVSIYKQLAKALHPDLEQDPALRERKHTLMQELTKAHREGDLHTLLRLELEWIKREEGDLEKLGDEKLGIYCELLEEQVTELQAELREVAFAPRFGAITRFMNPMTGAPGDIERILLALRQLSESLKGFRDSLSGPEGRRALRTILQEVAEERRRAESVRFDEGF